jgi:hypothetical protein
MIEIFLEAPLELKVILLAGIYFMMYELITQDREDNAKHKESKNGS